ncbi:MAG: translocation/assembly module TamB domain-containing protein [Aureibaculum sp.]|nr:translocation/assembly module TamB domain-containing protein [Aureibaculum sp.]
MLLISILLIVVFSIPFVQTGIARIVTNKINKQYDTNIVVKKVDLSYLGNIKLKNIEINDHHNDSLIYVDKLTTSLFSGYKNVLDNKLEFNEIDLEGVHLYLKTYKDESNDNLSIFVDKFEDIDTTKNNSPPFLLSSSQLHLNDANFYLYDLNKQEGVIVFYRDIKGYVDDFKIEGPDVYANIREVSLNEDHGINVTNLTSNFKYSKTQMLFGSTKLETINSSIAADIVFNYNIKGLADFNNKVNIEANFVNAEVSLIDLHKFYKELGENDKINFTTILKGTLNDFTLDNLKLISNRNSTINGSFHIRNAVNSDNSFSLNAKIYDLSSNYQNLKQLLPNILGKNLPTTFGKLGRFNIAGQSFITNETVDAQLTINGDIGRIVSDLKLTNINDIDNAKYDGNVEFIDLDFGKIVNDSLIGKMSLVALVDGQGFTLEKINTSLKGNVSKYQYKGYTYNDIDVNGIFKNQNFDGSLISRDKNLKMNFQGLADLSSDIYKFDFIADVNYSDFNKLNLFKRDSMAVLKGVMAMKVNGNTLDNLAGEINFYNTSYTNQTDNYFFKNFNITSKFTDTIRTITINSTDIVDGRVRGNFKFNELGKLTGNSLGSIYTNYTPTNVTQGQFLDFNFKIYNKIVDVFFPEVKLGANTSIKGKINSDNEQFELIVRSPKVEAYENIIENIKLQIDNKNPLYNTLLSIDKINTKYYNIAELNLVNVTLNDTLFFRTDFIGGRKMDEKFNLSFYHTINENSKSVLGLKKSDINFKENKWLINPTNNKQNKVVFDKALNTFAFDKIKIISKDQEIDFAGVIGGENSTDLVLDLKDVKLQGITPYIDKLSLNGLVNGTVNYKKYNGEIFPTAQLKINDFYANNYKQGNLFIDANGTNSIKQYAIEVKLENDNANGFVINGEVDFTAIRPTILASYAIDKFNIKALNPLGEDVINNIRGDISGDGIISGLLENPDINGYLFLENAGLAIPYLNVNYDFIGKSRVELTNQTFKFLPTTLLDAVQDSEGILSGTISHYKFDKWKLDLAIDTDNLLVLNTEEQEDMEYYGTVFMNGNATIKGYTDGLVIDVEGKTNPGTEFIIPLSYVSTIGDSKLINFVSNSEKGINNNKQQDIIFNIVKGLTLNFGLEVTDDAIVEIVIDKNTGSILRGSGNAFMSIEINTNGKFEIYGTYIVSEGIYKFRNIVNKDFIVQPGGQVVWDGNPFDAFLNIDAVYKTKANPQVLLDNIAANTNRKIDVDLITKITGQLLNSDIDFDIELPNQNSVINSELAFKLKDEDTKMTQFFSLLTTGSFLDLEEGNLNIGNAALTGSISEKIASVLSGIIKSKGDKFELGVTYDIASKDDVRSYQLNDELGITVSTTIGDRLIVNGKVGVPVGTNTSANIVGEVEVQLPLNDEGTLNAKAYSRQNDIEYDVTDAEGYTQGVGLSWRVDFDNGKELKEKIFPGKKKKQKNQKKKDSIKTAKNLINFTSSKKKDKKI